MISFHTDIETVLRSDINLTAVAYNNKFFLKSMISILDVPLHIEIAPSFLFQKLSIYHRNFDKTHSIFSSDFGTIPFIVFVLFLIPYDKSLSCLYEHLL